MRKYSNNRGARASGERRDIHAEITAKIVAELEAGALPWVKDWQGSRGPLGGMPRNVISKRAYSGINVVLLWMAAAKAGYASNDWLTFKQAKERGGSVRAGEKGTMILFYKKLNIQERQESGDAIDKQIMMARAYYVFNVAQCDGLKIKAPAEIKQESAEEIDARFMADVAKTGARIVHGGDIAGYLIPADVIYMPLAASFSKASGYIATLAHELVHWTGHKSRLDRFEGNKDRTEYAFEELVAELGAAFICSEYGVKGDLRHAGYIDHFITLLKSDKRALFRAASRASKAVQYLFPTTAEDEDNEEEEAQAA